MITKRWNVRFTPAVLPSSTKPVPFFADVPDAVSMSHAAIAQVMTSSTSARVAPARAYDDLRHAPGPLCA